MLDRRRQPVPHPVTAEAHPTAASQPTAASGQYFDNWSDAAAQTALATNAAASTTCWGRSSISSSLRAQSQSLHPGIPSSGDRGALGSLHGRGSRQASSARTA
jgi:hypothetical protein